jgi:predicted regulator of Ras-like GTPase activity (Roadblock/LC7/MglB family)
MFREHLQKIVDNVEGGVAGLLMGFDGIAVDSYTAPDPDADMDIQTMGMEFSFVMTQMRKAAEILEIGPIQEVSIKAENVTLVMRILSQDYFIAVALKPEGNFGKARFLMRLQVPKLLADLA